MDRWWVLSESGKLGHDRDAGAQDGGGRPELGFQRAKWRCKRACESINAAMMWSDDRHAASCTASEEVYSRCFKRGQSQGRSLIVGRTRAKVDRQKHVGHERSDAKLLISIRCQSRPLSVDDWWKMGAGNHEQKKRGTELEAGEALIWTNLYVQDHQWALQRARLAHCIIGSFQGGFSNPRFLSDRHTPFC